MANKEVTVYFKMWGQLCCTVFDVTSELSPTAWLETMEEKGWLLGFREEKLSQDDRNEKPSIGELKQDTLSRADSRMAVECAGATGNMDGTAAGTFYRRLLSMNVPEDVAGKMAVAYARGRGG